MDRNEEDRLSVLNEGVKTLVSVCHDASQNAGWWREYDMIDSLSISDSLKKYFKKNVEGTKYALIHSEASEGLEGLRKDLDDDKLPHRPMEEVELADLVIRVADYAGKKGFDLGGAIIEKLSFNATRADHRLSNRAAEGGKAV